MPGLDGFELLRRLRADPATRALPVLVSSAQGGPSVERARQLTVLEALLNEHRDSFAGERRRIVHAAIIT